MPTYISRCRRPDIVFTANKASRNLEESIISDWNKVIHTLHYLNTTKKLQNKI